LSDSLKKEREEEAETPFSITVVAKPKHTILYALAKRVGSVTALARELGVSTGTLSGWINLREMPTGGVSRDGTKRYGPWSSKRQSEVMLRLVKMTGRPIEEIFPTYVREKLSDIPRTIERVMDGVPMLRMGQNQQQRLEAPAPDAQAIANEVTDMVQEALHILNHQERVVIDMMFGLSGYSEARVLDDVGKVLHVSRERVRQIKDRAIQRLRDRGRLDTLNSERGEPID
jgi:RNA polymerase sigma factor (sigma-70 family)